MMQSLLALSKQQVAAAPQKPHSQHMGMSSVRSQDVTFSKMHAGEGPEGFLLRFESAAARSTLPKEEWALSGEGQAVYQALPSYAHEDYDQMKDALLNNPDVGEEHYRKKFRSLTFSAGTKAQSVARSLRKWGRKWLKPDIRSAEEIVELIIVEQFIQILPADADQWLSHQQTSSLDSIVQVIEEYLLAKNLHNKSKDHIEEAQQNIREHDALFRGAVPVKSEIEQMIAKVEPSLLHCPKPEDVKHEKLSGPDHQHTQDVSKVFVAEEHEMWRKYDGTLEEMLQTNSVSTQVKKEKMPDQENEIRRSPLTTLVQKGNDAGNLLPPFNVYGTTVNNFLTLKPEERHLVENRYICAECGKSFTMYSDSCDPPMTSSVEDPYTCTECDSQFSHSLHQIIDHQIKASEGQYVCGECGRRFSGSSHLAIHKRKHTGERPFECCKCGMTFCQQRNLVRHQKIHTDVKPYACTECGKSFRRPFHLTRHQLTHTGEKPYTCERCGDRFSLLSNMLVHQKRKICYSRV